MIKIRRWILPTVLLAGGAMLMAQGLSNRPFLDFKMPEVDAQGNLKWNLHGDSGRMRTEDVLELNGVTMQFYKEGKVDMTVTTPACLFDRKTRRAETDEAVKIESPDRYVITGRGLEWESGKNVVLLRHEVKVVLTPRAASEAVSGGPKEGGK